MRAAHSPPRPFVTHCSNGLSTAPRGWLSQGAQFRLTSVASRIRSVFLLSVAFAYFPVPDSLGIARRPRGITHSRSRLRVSDAKQADSVNWFTFEAAFRRIAFDTNIRDPCYDALVREVQHAMVKYMFHEKKKKKEKKTRGIPRRIR